LESSGVCRPEAIKLQRKKSMPTFALVDCNNFYASCEKLFDPQLKDKPVVVLSNNDGCVVARSAEAKALQVPMGVPWFQIQAMAKRFGIIARSSNYALYADMSNRVVEILSSFSPNYEVYSIDESFLNLDGMHTQAESLAAYGQRIRQRIAQWLGLAVCVGIAPTKTLAKLANHCAKKSLAGHDGVCDFTTMSEDALHKLFATIEVGEVWGVGRRLSEQLEQIGIRTVEQLRNATPNLIRSRFSVVLERTVRELRGISCLSLEEMTPNKQQIMSSRSFGTLIYELPELEEAVASYVARAAEKLRAQDSLAGAVQVYIRTNIFKPEVPQYQRNVTLQMPEASSDTRALTRLALYILRKIYRQGYAYHKAGIALCELTPRQSQQFSLLDVASGADPRSQVLMQTLDAINLRYGRGALRVAAEGLEKAWRMKREKLSPCYTTDWEGLAPVIAG
jgi:DNA polymerase V